MEGPTMHRHVIEPAPNGCEACAVEVALLRELQERVANMSDTNLTAGGVRVTIISDLARLIRKAEDR